MTNPLPVEERALTVSKNALTISRWALWTSIVSALAAIASVIAGVASWQESQRANDTIQKNRAANVFFSSKVDPSGEVKFYIVNRNDVPVSEVSFDYEVNGQKQSRLVFIGLIPACTEVQAMPESVRQNDSGYKPNNLYLRDIDGNSWRRDATGNLSPSSPIATNSDKDMIAEGSPIDGGC